MDEQTFWQIIDQVKADDSDEEHAERLVDVLIQLPPGAILEFQRYFDTLHTKAHRGWVWAAGMLLNGGHGTDDGFIYFRNWLISRGQAVYELALVKPDSLVAVPVELDEEGRSYAEFEAYSYAAVEAYEYVTGGDLYQALETAALSCTECDFPEPSFDWQEFDDDQLLAKELPGLWTKYGRFKQQADQWQLENEDAGTVEEKDIPRLGLLRIGSIVEHQKFGQGRVIDLYEHGPRGSIEFADGVRPMMLSPDFLKLIK